MQITGPRKTKDTVFDLRLIPFGPFSTQMDRTLLSFHRWFELLYRSLGTGVCGFTTEFQWFRERGVGRNE